MSFYIIDFVFFIIFIVGLIFNKFDKTNIIFSLIYITALLIIGFYLSSNILDYSRDAILYVDWFKRIQFSSIDYIFDDGKDILFQIMIKFVQLFSIDQFYIFIFFILLISFLKYKFVNCVASGSAAFILIWLIYSQTFILYELTQIRGGLAISIASYAIAYNLNKKNNLHIYGCFLAALLIHLSSLIIIIVYFLSKILFKNKLINEKVILIILSTSFFLKILFENLVSLNITNYFSNIFRINSYLDGTYSDITQVSLLSILFILKIVFIIFGLIFWKKITYQDKFYVYLSAIGCSFYMILSFNGVLALRISELFILFSLGTFIIPLKQKFEKREYNYIFMLGLFFIGFCFCYSSHKILLGYS